MHHAMILKYKNNKINSFLQPFFGFIRNYLGEWRKKQQGQEIEMKKQKKNKK